MKKLNAYIIFNFIVLLSSSLQAAAFLEHINGQPYVWKPNANPIVYRVETGNLTGSVSNAQARTILTQAFSVWENVFGAHDFMFNEGTSLGVDINVNNYKNYIDINTSGNFFNKTSDTVVIFDDTGAIINDLFSEVAPGSGATILGIASPGQFNANNFEITAGFVLINGAVTGSDNDVIKATATHELGHLLNLAHSQLNSEQALNASSADDDVVPTMFPFIPDDATVSESLELDDQFSMSLLYPDSIEIATRNEIRGHILRKNGAGVRAVNVTCRDDADPLKTAVSYLSDQSYINDGNYVCGLLPSGDYTVQIEAVEAAINTYNPHPPFIETEFYNVNNESFDAAVDLLNESSLVNVSGAGNLVQDIDIVVNNNGRMFSGQTVSSQTFEQYSTRGYFINVPSGARSLTVNLNWLNSLRDLDLFVKCEPEFSISGAAPNLYNQSSAFSDEIQTTSETIVLNNNTNPKLEDCQYHIIVQKFNPTQGETVDFTLDVTVDADLPTRLRSKAEDINKLYQGNEHVVASKVMQGYSEKFDVFSLEFQESISPNLSQVLSASLYLDSNKNKILDSEDKFLQTTSSFDVQDLSFIFDDIFFSVGEETETRVFVTYTLQPQSASMGLFCLCLLVLAIFTWCFNSLKKKLMVRFGLFIVVSLLPLSCQKPKLNYKPVLVDENSVTAVGQTFNDQFIIDIDESGQYDSVVDYFD
ncbi:MAG TPA: hypothetical protein PKC21_02135 [Oligoflexia bacterium]|nr:hypothetical protein [Oligoflexia bacterium]HMR24129.1 hypothetical protein [Oligoflexia bacterium]